MTRRSFGGGTADFVASVGISQILAVKPLATITMWTAKSGGSQVTDLLDASSAAVTVIQTDAYGNVPPFSGPNDSTAILWADAGGGLRVALHATDTEARVAALETAPGGVTSVAGKSGAVTLVKGDVGLGNVDNTADASKPVSTAQAAADTAAVATAAADATTKANAAQAAAVQRANHTGTQTASTISDFNTAAVTATAGSFASLPALGVAVRYVVASGGNDSNDGRTWATGYATVAAAVAALVSSPGYGVVVLGPGTFNLSTTLNLKQGIQLVGQGAIGAASGGSVLNWTGADDGTPAVRTSLDGSTTADWSFGQISKCRIESTTPLVNGGAGLHWRNAQNGSHPEDLFIRGFGVGVLVDNNHTTQTNTFPGYVSAKNVWCSGNVVNWKILAPYTSMVLDMCKGDATSITTDVMIVTAPTGSSSARGGRDGVLTLIGFAAESNYDVNLITCNTDTNLNVIGGSFRNSSPGTKPLVNYTVTPVSANIPAGCIPVNLDGVNLQGIPYAAKAATVSPAISLGVSVVAGGDTTQVTWEGNPTAPAKWQGTHSGFVADQVQVVLSDPTKVGVSVVPAPSQSASIAQWAANLIADTVTRGNSSSSPGGSWTVAGGTWGVSSNQLYAVTGGGSMDAFTVQDPATADGTYRADVTLSGTSGHGFAGLIFRYIDTSNHLRAMLKQSTGEFLLQKNDAGTLTTLLNIAPGLTAGSTYTMVVVLNGATITVTLNGTLVGSYTLTGGDATKFTSPTKVGLYVNAQAASPFDDGGSRFDNVYFAAPTVRVNSSGNLQTLSGGVWSTLTPAGVAPLDKRYVMSRVSTGALQSENVPRSGLSTTVLVAGTLYASRITLWAGSYTTVSIAVSNQVACTGCFFVLYDAVTLAKLAVSADVSASTFVAPVGIKTATMNYTVPTDATDYFIALMTTTGTPTLVTSGVGMSDVGLLAPVTASRHNTTGLSAVPDPLVHTATKSGVIQPWMRYE
jgi:hypothetical protein